MNTTFNREAAADCLENLMFGDTRVFCGTDAPGWEGDDDVVFDDLEDFERYCASDGKDPYMVEWQNLRDYLYNAVMLKSVDVSEKLLSCFLEMREVATVMAAGRSASARSIEGLEASLATCANKVKTFRGGQL